MKDIFIFGASGHAKVVMDIVETSGKYHIKYLIDDSLHLKGMSIYGYPVLGNREDLKTQAQEHQIHEGIIAIGNNQIRAAIEQWCLSHHLELVTAVHSSAQISRSVQINAGTVVMAGAVINPDTKIGRNAIINTQASIDHECSIEDWVHIGPGATICGNVHIGEYSLIGAGSTILPNLKIGKQVTVGAGTTITRDVPDYVTMVGTPAKRIRSKEEPPNKP